MSGAGGRARLALAQQVSSMVLMVGFAIVSSRWLGPTGKGELALVITAGLVAASVLALGIPQALTAWVSRDSVTVSHALSVGLRWSIALSLLLFLISTIAQPSTLALAFLWLSVGAAVADQVLCGVSVGSGHLGPQLLYRWLGGGSQILFMGGALLLGVSAASHDVVIWYYALTWVSIVVAGLVLLRESRGSGSLEASEPAAAVRSEVTALLGFGIKAVPGQVLSMTNYKLDMLLLGWLVGASEVGVYSLAVSATLLVGFVPVALGQALTRSFGSDDDSRMALRRGTQLALASGLLSAAVIAVASYLLVPTVFGEGFAPAVGLIFIMVPFTALFSTVQVSFPFFYNRLHRPLAQSLVIGVTAAIDVALVLILAPSYGAAGAAIASAVAYGAGFVVNTVVTARGAQIGIRELLVPGPDDRQWMWLMVRDSRSWMGGS